MRVFDNDYFKELADKIDAIQRDLEIIKENHPESLDKKWLTHEEVCKLLKVCTRTLYHYREKGIIPYSHNAETGRAYYKLQDIEDFLENSYHDTSVMST